MLFADDCYLYCNASDVEAENMSRLLQVFEQASGQKVNLIKSVIFFSTNVKHGKECSCATGYIWRRMVKILRIWGFPI